MDAGKAADRARELMREFGIDQEVGFEFDRSVRRFGCYHGGTFTEAPRITLSRKLVELNDEPTVERIIRHEIAHALAPWDGHGWGWRQQCKVVGIPPERCYNSAEVVQPVARWSAKCGACGKVYTRVRLTTKVRMFSMCTCPSARHLTWEELGR